MVWLPFRSIIRRPIASLVTVVLAWSLLDANIVRQHLRLAARDYQANDVLSSPVRIYIASLHWNSESILNEFWNHALVNLAQAIGPSNVYVSILESGSWDGSKVALGKLAEALDAIGVAKKITLDDTTHADVMAAPPAETGQGWIRTPEGKIALRRIPYLSRLQNRSLEPLRELANNGTVFDYVLFLSDIYFSVSDVFTLLNTNSGRYAAACSLDFSHPPKYYDTFALRDSEGHEHAIYTWPYFRSRKSRAALKQSKPVPVSSCWNGMVVMPATSFLSPTSLFFRGIDDTLASQRLEGSECCLVHADNPISSEPGVYLNPNVRVGYSTHAYRAVHPAGSLWIGSYCEIWLGLWKNRFYRWITTPFFKEWVCLRRLREWEDAHPARHENGAFCLINEMQILVENGWAHV